MAGRKSFTVRILYLLAMSACVHCLLVTATCSRISIVQRLLLVGTAKISLLLLHIISQHDYDYSLQGLLAAFAASF